MSAADLSEVAAQPIIHVARLLKPEVQQRGRLMAMALPWRDLRAKPVSSLLSLGIVSEHVVALFRYGVARESALCIIPLRRFVLERPYPERSRGRLIVE